MRWDGKMEQINIKSKTIKVDQRFYDEIIRKIIEQGGLMINNEKHTDPMEETKLKSGDIVKLGKRRYAKVK